MPTTKVAPRAGFPPFDRVIRNSRCPAELPSGTGRGRYERKGRNRQCLGQKAETRPVRWPSSATISVTTHEAPANWI
jgi:hypothetical protein